MSHINSVNRGMPVIGYFLNKICKDRSLWLKYLGPISHVSLVLLPALFSYVFPSIHLVKSFF